MSQSCFHSGLQEHRRNRADLHDPCLVPRPTRASHGQEEKSGHTGEFNRKLRKTSGHRELRHSHLAWNKDLQAGRWGTKEGWGEPRRNPVSCRRNPPIYVSAVHSPRPHMEHSRFPIPAFWFCSTIGEWPPKASS